MKKKEMAQEVFDALFADAVQDLRKSGLPETEVFSIIKNQFGHKYVRRFCDEGQKEGGDPQ